jgi:hypothetical protein
MSKRANFFYEIARNSDLEYLIQNCWVFFDMFFQIRKILQTLIFHLFCLRCSREKHRKKLAPKLGFFSPKFTSSRYQKSGPSNGQ